uniref:beta-N-acetylhexosaminidase n=1 Tax=Nilaparvata lugens TaxID=108931 RepID=A0A0C5CUF2_NILLU|nr:beta-N-acetylhexosaminidase [Nilaparvata lugens]
MASQHLPVVFKGHCIVHLDLKGAPPRVSYYEEIFPLIKELGGTGLLIEYEDMFPYRHVQLTAKNAYSKADIAKIIQLAADNDLIVIPLIQTFGHLEFVLKLKEFKHLREVPKYPQVICPSRNASLSLLKDMIDDMLELHPTSQLIHIGSDEVYYLGDCEQCQQRIASLKWDKRDLFLNHMTTVAKYIKSKKPSITVLAWDDEFRQMSLEELLASNVGKLVEPVVWKYTLDIPVDVSLAISEKYAEVFPNIWIASAFKGATGSDMIVTDIDYHWRNHVAWMQVVSALAGSVNIRGIFLTGWQRYDHFSVLCELLPVGFPSLAVNLAYLSSSKMAGSSWPNTKATRVLKCDNAHALKKVGTPVNCAFPGAGVFAAVTALYTLHDSYTAMTANSHFRGWFSDYNIRTAFASPSHIEEATSDLGRLKMELSYVRRDLQKAMLDVYDASVSDEWLATNVRPLELKLTDMWEAKERLLASDDWPRRPLADHNSPAVDH